MKRVMFLGLLIYVLVVSLPASKGEFELGLALSLILMIIAFVVNFVLHWIVRRPEGTRSSFLLKAVGIRRP